MYTIVVDKRYDEIRDEFCLVRVGGVNTIGDATKLSCLVELAV